MLCLIDLHQLEFIDRTLRAILYEVQEHYGMPFVITSLYRIDSPGVHGTLPLRGIDVRCREKELAVPIVEFVNSRWQYDPDRPKRLCCMAHDTGQGFHLHFQVHPNTKNILSPRTEAGEPL